MAPDASCRPREDIATLRWKSNAAPQRAFRWQAVKQETQCQGIRLEHPGPRGRPAIKPHGAWPPRLARIREAPAMAISRHWPRLGALLIPRRGRRLFRRRPRSRAEGFG